MAATRARRSVESLGSITELRRRLAHAEAKAGEGGGSHAGEWRDEAERIRHALEASEDPPNLLVTVQRGKGSEGAPDE